MAERWPPVRRTQLAVALTYTALIALGGGFMWVGYRLPCDTFMCHNTNQTNGLVLGGALALALAAWAGRRLGMRWWFVPAVLVLGLGFLGLGRSFDEVAWFGFPQQAGDWLAALSPVLAGGLAGSLGRRRATLLVVATVVLGLVGAGVSTVGLHTQRRQDITLAAWRFEQAQVPIVAPIGAEGVRVRLGTVRDEPGWRSVAYQVRVAGEPTWLDVTLTADPTGESADACGDSAQDMGGGVRLASTGMVCRSDAGVDVSLWASARPSEWTTEDVVALARSLRPASVAWLVEHAE